MPIRRTCLSVLTNVSVSVSCSLACNFQMVCSDSSALQREFGYQVAIIY